MSSLRKSVERLVKLQEKIPRERLALSASRKCIGPNMIVTYHKGSYRVRSEYRRSTSAFYCTQEEAVERAKKIANALNSEVLIYGRDGRIMIQDNKEMA